MQDRWAQNNIGSEYQKKAADLFIQQVARPSP